MAAGGSAKGQAGLSPELTTEFATTGLNPVLLDATGTYLIMHNIPSLPQIPASPQLLKALWPRLQMRRSRRPQARRTSGDLRRGTRSPSASPTTSPVAHRAQIKLHCVVSLAKKMLVS